MVTHGMKKLAAKPAAQRMRYGERSMLGFSGTAAATAVSDEVAVGVVSVRGLTLISSYMVVTANLMVYGERLSRILERQIVIGN